MEAWASALTSLLFSSSSAIGRSFQSFREVPFVVHRCRFVPSTDTPYICFCNQLLASLKCRRVSSRRTLRNTTSLVFRTFRKTFRALNDWREDRIRVRGRLSILFPQKPMRVEMFG
ncbi:hypothetical protein PsorP6_012472 [Peronosclerospora sorghi]|uniref:Uncharacterized protein n=1 Tax=Peronosclerospora sorghi TaxID=230839 RepID=A0ACC0WET1_9STRA|nr:hypothetical protein PsorP6_012472 [Peronosclerospora sorghi]